MGKQASIIVHPPHKMIGKQNKNQDRKKERKMSLAKGKDGQRRSRGQAHQNRFAFKHNPHSKKTDRIAKIHHASLCRKCDEKIEWRKKFRKYKPRKVPGKCRLCEQKNVARAYEIICKGCAGSKRLCAICIKPRDDEESEVDEGLAGARHATQKDVDAYMSSLALREQKKIERQLDRGLITFFKLEDGSLAMRENSLEEEEEEEEEVDTTMDGDNDDAKTSETLTE